MKILILTLSLIFYFTLFSKNDYPIYENVLVTDQHEYSPEGSNKLYVSSPFGESSLFIPEDALTMKDRKIKKISYCYSKNNNNPDFKQNSLSDTRYENFITAFPQIKKDNNIVWETLMQTGCGTNRCSEQLYHGFIIEFDDQVEKEVFSNDFLDDQYFKMNPNVENTIEGVSGTKVLIPANAFIRKNGQQVQGDVFVKVKEGISIEDIVLGGLVTVTEGNQILESGGMVQITAVNEGYEVELKEGQRIAISILNIKKQDMQIFSGVDDQGILKWNNPIPLNENIEFQEEKQEQVPLFDIIVNAEGEDEWSSVYQLSSIQHQKEGDKIEWIKIIFEDEEYTFLREEYTKEGGIEIGLNEFQANQIDVYFQCDTIQNIPTEFWGELQFFDGEQNIKNVLVRNELIMNWGVPVDGRNAFQEDASIRTIFQTNQLGWANIDRLASFPNSKKVKFAVSANEIDALDNLKISMVIPQRKMYLPGYKKEDGNYSFTHGDYEEHTFPVGDQAYIIAIGEVDGITYFDMIPLILGENEIENILLKETDKETALSQIRQTI